MATKREKELAKLIDETFPNKDDEERSEIVNRLIALGVDEPEDLGELKEEDLKAIFPPVTARKILKLGGNAVHGMEPVKYSNVESGIHGQGKEEKEITERECQETKELSRRRNPQTELSKTDIVLKTAASSFVFGARDYLVPDLEGKIWDHFHPPGTSRSGSLKETLIGAAATGTVRAMGNAAAISLLSIWE